jgi:hypothetical protein
MAKKLYNKINKATPAASAIMLLPGRKDLEATGKTGVCGPVAGKVAASSKGPQGLWGA